jgi:hypothetical protein
VGVSDHITGRRMGLRRRIGRMQRCHGPTLTTMQLLSLKTGHLDVSRRVSFAPRVAGSCQRLMNRGKSDDRTDARKTALASAATIRSDDDRTSTPAGCEGRRFIWISTLDGGLCGHSLRRGGRGLARCQDLPFSAFASENGFPGMG